MKTIKKTIQLIIFSMLLRVKDFVECCRVVRRYFAIKRFAFSWCWLKCCYLLGNPYRCSRQYASKQDNSDELIYGETPLSVLEKIALEANISAQDHVFELGSGSGYTCLWLNCVIGCRVTAIEKVPVFCWHLGRVTKRFHLGINVRCENFLATDFSGATVIYLYGSAMREESIVKLASRLEKLPKGTTIISVSYSLSGSVNSGAFETIKQLQVCFDWGEADVFIQKIV